MSEAKEFLVGDDWSRFFPSHGHAMLWGGASADLGRRHEVRRIAVFLHKLRLVMFACSLWLALVERADGSGKLGIFKDLCSRIERKSEQRLLGRSACRVT